MKRLKVLAGPVNYANQAMVRTRALQARGHDAHHVLYDWGSGVRYGFDRDIVVEMNRQDWLTVQLSVVGDALRTGYDVYELRNRTLVYPPGGFGFFNGYDLPYIKGSGAKLVYGFTGYDLRRKSVEMERNPHSPWHHGLQLQVNEDHQLRYLDYLRQWVDCFVVTDPEMQSYLPEAEILPRALDLKQFAFVGVERPRRPLVVHSPSDRVMKGSDHVIQAVEELQAEGLDFEFKLIEQMDHSEAAEWLRRADVIVDQVRIGWYGVAAVEGMALGKPVIAYLLDHARERMTPEVPVVNASPDTLKHRLGDLVRDADLRLELAEKGRAFAEQVHDIDKVVERLEQLYYRVLDREPAPADVRPPDWPAAFSEEPLQAMTDATRYENLRTKHLPELVRKARLYDELQARGMHEAPPAPVQAVAAPPAPAAAPASVLPAFTAGQRRLRVCIFSRKDLSRITRIVRQARVLLDAGHEVVVVCRGKPVDELTATVPEVEWVELELDSWTRRYAIRKRLEHRERAVRRKRRLAQASPSSQRLLRAAYAIRDRVAGWLRLAFLAAPGTVLLANGLSWRARWRELRNLDTPRLLSVLVQPFAQRAASLGFAEQASLALAGRPFDICQAHDNYALLAARRLASESGAKLVYDAVEISEHRVITSARDRGLLPLLAERRERREEARIIQRDVAATLTIGDGLADWYEKRYRMPRPTVVRNCRHYWPYERRQEIRRDCGVGRGDVLVVWFGYAYPEQGLETIVEAAQHAAPNVHFALLVDILPRWKEFYDSVRGRARELQVAERVHFLPARDPNDLISYVSGADVGIIPRPNVGPNVYFSLPNKFMEMVMARLPIVVSDLVDMRELVERYEIGAVFDVTDPVSVARTIQEVAESRNQKPVRAALERAAQELSWENEGTKYLELISSIGGAAASGRVFSTPPAVGAPAPPSLAHTPAAPDLVAAALAFLADQRVRGRRRPDGGAFQRMSRVLSSRAVARTERKVEALGFRGARRVLLGGAGDGVWPLVLAQANEHVDVLEHRPGYLELGTRLAKGIGAGRIAFRRGQLDDAEYPAAHFDLAVTDRTLMHLDHELAFANLGEWLAEDGRVYCSYASQGARLQLVASSFVDRNFQRADAELRILLADSAFRAGLGRIPRSQSRALTPDELVTTAEAYGLAVEESPGLHGGLEEFSGVPATFDFVFTKSQPSAPADPRKLLRAGLPRLALRRLLDADAALSEPGAYELFVEAAVKANHVPAGIQLDPVARGVTDPFLIGLWRQSRGEFREAVDSYAATIDSKPDAAFLTGLCHMALRDFAAAASAFEIDLAHDSGQARARAGLASAALAMEQPEQAFRIFGDYIGELGPVPARL